MMRVERLVVPAAKSCCSSSNVRRPARAHSRAIATPLIPPPITITSKRLFSSAGRNFMLAFRCLSWLQTYTLLSLVHLLPHRKDNVSFIWLSGAAHVAPDASSSALGPDVRGYVVLAKAYFCIIARADTPHLQ